MFFGGLVGYNASGSLENSLVTGATIPEATQYYGAIVGCAPYTDKLSNNYYTNCKVGDNENATKDVGCGGTLQSQTLSDIADNNGAVPKSLHSITFGEGISITSPAEPSITIGGINYYESNTEITLSYEERVGSVCCKIICRHNDHTQQAHLRELLSRRFRKSYGAFG